MQWNLAIVVDISIIILPKIVENRGVGNKWFVLLFTVLLVSK